MMGWFRNLFRPAVPREVVCVSWTLADKMLKESAGWKIAREEDTNRQIGFVYLERPAQQRSPESAK